MCGLESNCTQAICWYVWFRK